MAFKVFTTAEVLATVVQPEDDLCVALKKVNESYRLAYKLVRYLFNDDGTISDAACAQIKSCAANTPNATTTG